jgi:hypothetical protein
MEWGIGRKRVLSRCGCVNVFVVEGDGERVLYVGPYFSGYSDVTSGVWGGCGDVTVKNVLAGDV